MVAGGKLTAAQCNMVHVEQIWKDYVKREIVVAKKWSGTWGFLKDEYRTLCDDTALVRKRRGLKPQRRLVKEKAPLKLPPLEPPRQDTSNPFPLVTSREIGWRSSRPECKLEVYGRWGRPKYSIVKHLKWPNDAVP